MTYLQSMAANDLTDSTNAFLVTAGKSFRLSAVPGQPTSIPTSSECAAGARKAGVKCDRSRWRGSVWIEVPATLRERCIAAEAASKS